METTRARPLYLDSTRTLSERIQDLMGRMSPEEKLAQLSAYWDNDLQIHRELSREKMRTFLGSGIGEISRIGGPPPARFDGNRWAFPVSDRGTRFRVSGDGRIRVARVVPAGWSATEQ